MVRAASSKTRVFERAQGQRVGVMLGEREAQRASISESLHNARMVYAPKTLCGVPATCFERTATIACARIHATPLDYEAFACAQKEVSTRVTNRVKQKWVLKGTHVMKPVPRSHPPMLYPMVSGGFSIARSQPTLSTANTCASRPVMTPHSPTGHSTVYKGIPSTYG